MLRKKQFLVLFQCSSCSIWLELLCLWFNGKLNAFPMHMFPFMFIVYLILRSAHAVTFYYFFIVFYSS